MAAYVNPNKPYPTQYTIVRNTKDETYSVIVGHDASAYHTFATLQEALQYLDTKFSSPNPPAGWALGPGMLPTIEDEGEELQQ